MKESSSVIEQEEQNEVATNLVTREVRWKKATEVFLVVVFPNSLKFYSFVMFYCEGHD